MIVAGIAYWVIATALTSGVVKAQAHREVAAVSRRDSPDLIRYAYIAWERVGRPWLAHNSSTEWIAEARTWRLRASESPNDSDIAQLAYYAEYALRPALALAESQRDRQMLDELARFYVAFRPRFVSLGRLRRAGTISAMLAGQGKDDALVLPWYEHANGATRVRECQLCTGQFLHPASRLLHLIAQVPRGRRTSAMNGFVAAYGPLLVKDFVIRLAFEGQVDRYGFRVRRPGLLTLWDSLSAAVPDDKPSYRRAMLDSDLWLLAVAAELLAATQFDRSFVSATDRAQLTQVVQSGARLLQTKRHIHHFTSDGTESSTTVSYFDGDFCDHPDMAYSGRADSVVPNRGDSARACNASWDISHAYRIPITLLSLFEARRAAAINSPTEADIRLVIRQYLHRASYQLDGHTYFRTFFDGTDGWYRLYWEGTKPHGYSPPRWCDSRTADHECLTIGALFGWGQLASFDRGLQDFEHELIELAASKDTAAMEFRRRYFTFANQEFAFGAQANAGSLLLFSVVAESLSPAKRSW